MSGRGYSLFQDLCLARSLSESIEGSAHHPGLSAAELGEVIRYLRGVPEPGSIGNLILAACEAEACNRWLKLPFTQS